MHLDRLENRALFAASVSMVHGVVAIRGSSGADNVRIDTVMDQRKSANRITHNDLQITLNGYLHTFDAGKVRSIIVRLGAGDDTFNMGRGELAYYKTTGKTYLPTREQWDVEVDGGAGNDILLGSNSSEILHGGDGNDTINGGAGNDAVYGDAGNDLLTEDGGVDRLDGGHGDDTILLMSPQKAPNGRETKVYGGNGDDQLYANFDSSFFTRLVEHTHNMSDPNAPVSIEYKSYGADLV